MENEISNSAVPENNVKGSMESPTDTVNTNAPILQVEGNTTSNHHSETVENETKDANNETNNETVENETKDDVNNETNNETVENETKDDANNETNNETAVENETKDDTNNETNNETVENEVKEDTNNEVINETVENEVKEDTNNEIVNENVVNEIKEDTNNEVVNETVENEVKEDTNNKVVSKTVENEVKEDTNNEIVNENVVNEIKEDTNNEVINETVENEVKEDTNNEVVNETVENEVKEDTNNEVVNENVENEIKEDTKPSGGEVPVINVEDVTENEVDSQNPSFMIESTPDSPALMKDISNPTSPVSPTKVEPINTEIVQDQTINPSLNSAASAASEAITSAWNSVSNYLWSWFEQPEGQPEEQMKKEEIKPTNVNTQTEANSTYGGFFGSFFGGRTATDETSNTLTVQKKTSTSSLSSSRLNLLSQQARMPSVQFIGREENDDNIQPIVDRELTDYIRPHLPLYQRESVKWVLRYSTAQHGISLNTLYQKVEGAGPLLLAIRDTDNNIFGAYVSEAFHVRKGFYGTRECFLWKYIKGGLKMYPTSGHNEYFILSEADYIAIGGGNGSYGLYIDEDIQNGQSAECTAFFNEPLSSSVHFQILSLEVWAFEM